MTNFKISTLQSITSIDTSALTTVLSGFGGFDSVGGLAHLLFQSLKKMLDKLLNENAPELAI